MTLHLLQPSRRAASTQTPTPNLPLLLQNPCVWKWEAAVRQLQQRRRLKRLTLRRKCGASASLVLGRHATFVGFSQPRFAPLVGLAAPQ